MAVPLRRGIEAVVAAGVVLAVTAFVASFALGLRGGAPAPRAVTADRPALTVPAHAGRVEVLNASGRSGLARAVTGQLRDAGFDVVFFGNASGFDPDSSLVLDRTGDDAVARAVARRLGIGIIRTARDTSLYLDATVVLGRDYYSGR
jgi:hypothetical protein